MNKFQFEGDNTIDLIFDSHRRIIYDNVLIAIKKNYLKSEITEIHVVKITTHSETHSISLTRDKFITSLYDCIKFFEVIEEYETCQECVDIIEEIEGNLNKINDVDGI